MSERMGLGLSMRPARASDSVFLEQLHRATRKDLLLIDGERDFVETIIKDQRRFQNVGYGQNHPNAQYFIVEKLGESIGQVTVGIYQDRVHLLAVALIPEAQNHGYGSEIVRWLQSSAEKTCVPLTLSVLRNDPRPGIVYHALGFRVAQRTDVIDLMVWYPPAYESRIAACS